MGVGPFPRSRSRQLYEWVEDNASKKDKSKFYSFVQQWSINLRELSTLKKEGYLIMYHKQAKQALYTQTEWEDIGVRDRAGNILNALYKNRLREVRKKK